MSIDTQALNRFLHTAVVDLGAAFHAALVVIGDRLGLYRALAEHGPQAPAELARRTGTAERYVREWLDSQAAGGYVSYDPAERAYYLTPEQAQCLADEQSPTFLPGGFQVALSATRAAERIEQAFRSGEGMGWGEHDCGLFCGTERFFRPNYAAHLIEQWLPALDGVTDKLERGAQVADVGCGLGASTILMAQAFSRSTFTGYDYHPDSVAQAARHAEAAGVADRVRFEVASAKQFSGRFDLVAFFDCLHDMGDPAGAAAHTREQLAEDGTVMLVEPFAGDAPEANHNPIGRVFYSASTLLCVPCSLAQEVGAALGAQAGEERWRDVLTGAGFSRFRRAAQTPFNLVLEARP